MAAGFVLWLSRRFSEVLGAGRLKRLRFDSNVAPRQLHRSYSRLIARLRKERRPSASAQVVGAPLRLLFPQAGRPLTAVLACSLPLGRQAISQFVPRPGAADEN